MAQLQPVLLSGGSGTRLWPLSREAYPKQFLPLAGDDTMVQATWRRVEALADLAPIVVANEEHRFLVAEQLRQVGAPVPAILLEPVGRNTAPAIAAAALQAMAGGADPLLLVLPSDHVVRDVAGFQRAVREASSAAEAGALVTFGVVPDAPETGFGYIQAEAGDGLRKVSRFVEKKNLFRLLDAYGQYIAQASRPRRLVLIGYGPLEELIRDDRINDILVNGTRHIYVERGGVLSRTDLRFIIQPGNVQVVGKARLFNGQIGFTDGYFVMKTQKGIF